LGPCERAHFAGLFQSVGLTRPEREREKTET